MNKRTLALGCLAILLLLMFVAGSIYLFFTQYADYRARGGAAVRTTPARVSINSPLNGVIIPASSRITVSASAEGPEPFRQVEFLIDGAVAHVEAAPAAGASSFVAAFDWTPAEPDVYQLVARTTDSSGRLAVSAPVTVAVSPAAPLPALGDASGDEPPPGAAGETPNEAAAPAPVFLPAPGSSSQSAAAPATDDLVGTGQPWTGTPGNWIASLTAQAAPSAPKLVGAAGACGANLTIQDTSDNEEGFLIYRSGLDEDDWTQIAQLASQSQFEWLTFSDDDISGPFNYYVTAFNSQGESGSNIVLINIAPDGCSPPDEPPFIYVKLSSLSLNTPTDLFYCYISVEEGVWQRWPQEGFVFPTADGWKGGSSVLSLLPPNLDPEPAQAISLECWGWSGEDLKLLGQFQFKSPVGGQGVVDLSAINLSAQLEFFTFDPATMQTYEGDEAYQFPYDLFLTKPTVFSGTASPWCQILADPQVAGTPYYYCKDGEGNTPFEFTSHHVLWHTNSTSNCREGSFCFFAPFLHFFGLIDEVVNGEFGFNVYMFGKSASFAASYPSPHHKVFVPPGWLSSRDCQGTFKVGVSSYFIPAGSEQMFESETAWTTIPEPCPVEDVAIIEVDLVNLQFFGISEEPGEGDWLDIYARFTTFPNWNGHSQPGTTGSAIYLANRREELPDNCPAPDGVAPDDAGNYGWECPIGVVNTIYEVANLRPCYGGQLSGCDGPHGAGATRLFFAAKEGSSAQVWFGFRDKDVNSEDDPFCEGSIALPPMPFSEWASPTQKSLDVTVPDNGVGGCTVLIHVKPWQVYEAP